MSGEPETAPTRRERWLVRLLRIGGAIMLLAFLAVFMPTDWMARTHAVLGLGELPRDPVFQYLARSISALYGIHGGLLLLFAADLGRYLPAVRFVSAMNVVFGLFVLGIDLRWSLPPLWTAIEGPGIALGGAVLLWLCGGVGTGERR